jgi:hypothetical protein
MCQISTSLLDAMDIREVRVPDPCTNWGAMGYTNCMKSRASHAKFYRRLFEYVYSMCVNDLEAFYNFLINTATSLQIDCDDIKTRCLKEDALDRHFFKT